MIESPEGRFQFSRFAGVALYLDGGTAVIEDSTFTRNGTDRQGAANYRGPRRAGRRSKGEHRRRGRARRSRSRA